LLIIVIIIIDIIFRSGTDLISLLIILWLGQHCSKKPKEGFKLSNQIGLKFGGIVLPINVHQLTESDL